MTWPDPAAERLWVALTGTGRLRLGHGEVWKAWIGDDQGRSGSLDEYDRVIGLLADLEAAGRLRCSRKRTARGLPAQVTLLGVASPRRQVSAHGWRPELQWVPTARLSGRRLQQLLRINEWLRDRPEDLPTVPVAERSLDIFGRHGEPEPEKLLERLWPTLFQSGRTDPRALAVEQISLPFPRERFGDGATLLIAENKGTYHSLVRRAWERRAAPPVFAVGFGEGDRFLRTITSADPEVQRLHYFGDLDRKGLVIPVEAQAKAGATRPLEVVPAVPLYRALLACGVPSPAKDASVPVGEAERLAAWLPGDLREPVTNVLASGLRLAQEWVGYEALGAIDRWLEV